MKKLAVSLVPSFVLLLLIPIGVVHAENLKQYHGSNYTFNYPMSWGNLKDISKDFQGSYGPDSATYFENIAIFQASNKSIGDIYFHKQTKLIAFTERKDSVEKLLILKQNGSKKIVDSNGIHTGINFSPRDYFLFFNDGIDMSVWNVMYDTRTGKNVDLMDTCFENLRDIAFSTDSKQLAIFATTKNSPSLAMGDGIWCSGRNVVLIQDQKSLKLKQVYIFNQPAPKTLTNNNLVYQQLGNAMFNNKGYLLFDKIEKTFNDKQEVIKTEILTHFSYDLNKGELKQSIVPTKQEPSLAECPQSWFINKMPVIGSATNPSGYFILANGKNYDATPIDVAWVKSHCKNVQPQTVF